MSQNQNKTSTKDITIIALFAAITFVSVQFLKIPTTPPDGFFHLGNVFVMLGALLMGYKKGSVSAVIGLVLFDLINGYAQSIPKVIILTIIKCIIVAGLFRVLREKMNEYVAVVLATVCSFIVGIAGDYIFYVVENMLAGSIFSVAAAVAVYATIPTVTNAVISMVIVPILYPILRKILSETNNKIY